MMLYRLLLIGLLITALIPIAGAQSTTGNYTLQENVDMATDQFYIIAPGLIALFSVATLIGIIRLATKSIGGRR